MGKWFNDRTMSMIDSKSGNQIQRTKRIPDRFHDNIFGDSERTGVHEENSDQIMRQNEGDFFQISGSEIMIEMVKFPERKYQHLCGEEKDPLIAEPIRISHLCHLFVESNKGKGSQIHIMMEFLSGSMMFAMLIDPIIGASSDASAKDDEMCDFVEGHIAKESTMPHIVH